MLEEYLNQEPGNISRPIQIQGSHNKDMADSSNQSHRRKIKKNGENLLMCKVKKQRVI